MKINIIKLAVSLITRTNGVPKGFSRTAALVAFGVIGLGLSNTAHSVPITPGTAVPLSGVAPPAGTVLEEMSSIFTLFDDTNPLLVLATGRVDSAVVRETATGFLRFEYQLFVDLMSPGRVEFLIAFNFSTFTTAKAMIATDAKRSHCLQQLKVFLPG